MDRASSFSFGGRALTQFPNQPAPPPRAARYTGPQSRSYAQVVRQTNPRLTRRWVSPRAAGPDITRQPAGPQFGKLVRRLHMVIKMVHHLQNVACKEGKPEPRMISRMVEILSQMIKPASPTQRTVDLISGNAKNWGHNTYLILMEHYETGIADLLDGLTGLLTPDWKDAFQVAVRWAKRNLPRITREVIDHAEALVTARTGTGTGNSAQVEGLEQTNEPVQNQEPLPSTSGMGAEGLPQRRAVRQPTVTFQTEPVPQQGTRMTVGTMTESTDQGPTVWETTVGTMTEGTDQGPTVLESTPSTGSPTVQRGPRRSTRRSRPIISDSSSSESEPEAEVLEDPIQSSANLDLEPLFQEPQPEEQMGELEAPAPQNTMEVRAQVHREALVEEDGDDFEESFDHFTSPGPQQFRVFRHPNTQRKLTDWNLVVRKKFLIIGDSNLCSLPDFFNKDLQVESFPGGHFRHGQALMEKTIAPQGVVVEKVVLSFGINSRGNKSKETTVKNVQGAIRSTKRKFPYSEIWIPLVNFSQALPAEERENLEVLNDHIERNMPFIPLLPEDKFQTEADDVHWTSETGCAMFDHWMAILNCRTP